MIIFGSNLRTPTLQILLQNCARAHTHTEREREREKGGRVGGGGRHACVMPSIIDVFSRSNNCMKNTMLCVYVYAC